jgi:hypothetical protein
MKPVAASELLQEIIALGGSADDLDLVKGIDSDTEEVTTQKSITASFDPKEFKSFFKTLGFDALKRQEVDTDEENEESPVEEIVKVKPVLPTPVKTVEKPVVQKSTVSDAKWVRSCLAKTGFLNDFLATAHYSSTFMARHRTSRASRTSSFL